MSVKIGVLVSGGGTNLQALIDSIEAGRIDGEIRLVVSNKKDAYGLVRGASHGIESIYINRKEFQTEEDYNLHLIEILKRRGVELVVLAGYLRVLSKEFIRHYKNRIINIHPSLIPSFCGKGYYGIKVHESAIEYGVKLSGATVHFVDEGTDTGPIICQDIVRIEEGETPKSLQEKVLEVEHRLLVEAVRLYCDGRINVDGRIVSIS